MVKYITRTCLKCMVTGAVRLFYSDCETRFLFSAFLLITGHYIYLQIYYSKVVFCPLQFVLLQARKQSNIFFVLTMFNKNKCNFIINYFVK